MKRLVCLTVAIMVLCSAQLNVDDLPELEDDGLYANSHLLNANHRFNIISRSRDAWLKRTEERKEELESVEKQIKELDPEKLIKRIAELDVEISGFNTTLSVLMEQVHVAEDNLHKRQAEMNEKKALKEKSKDMLADLTEKEELLEDELEYQGEYMDEAFEVYDTLVKEVAKEELLFESISPSKFFGTWESAAGKYGNVSSRMSYDGIVFLSGAVQGGTFGDDSIVFKLPEMHVPFQRNAPFEVSRFPSIVDSKSGRIDILEGGNIAAVSPVGSNWIALDSISFPSSRAQAIELDIRESQESSVWTHSSYSSDINTPRLAYILGREGVVHLTGTIFVKAGRVPQFNHLHGSLVAMLPEHIRPKKWAVLPGMTMDHLSRVDVEVDGSIIIVFPTRGTKWYSFDGISFLTKNAKIEPAILLNNWKQYSPSAAKNRHSTPGHLRTKDGIVYLTGVVMGGATTDNNGSEAIFTLPENACPQSNRVFMAVGDNGVVRIEVHPDGNVYTTAPRTPKFSWISLDGISFPAVPIPNRE